MDTMDTTQDKEEQETEPLSHMEVYIPDCITICEQNALITEMKTYFESVIESKLYTNDDILKEKQKIVNSLSRMYRSYESHHEKYTSVMKQLDDHDSKF